MLSEDFSLKFEGFSPSEEVLKKIKISLSDLYSKSPHRSFVRATFKCTGQVFEGVIDITSVAGKFVAQTTNVDFDILSKQTFKDITKQLDIWKSERIL